MIAELGLGLLWLAAGLAIIQSALGMLGLWQTNRPDLGNAVRPVAVAQALLIGLSFACLIYLFISIVSSFGIHGIERWSERGHVRAP